MSKSARQQNFTDTNMFVECFANSEKLVESDKRVGYGDKVNIPTQSANPGPSVLPTVFENQEYVAQSHKDNSREEKEKEKDNASHASHNASHTRQTETATEEKEYDENDESTWSKDELLLKKLEIMRKLGELVAHGSVKKLSQNYNLNSDYKTMKFEYDLHSGIRAKKNAVEWMSGMMIGIVKGIELLNDKVNPFDIQFENTWSNNVTSDITNYYDVLGEIYEKYTNGKTMAPELKLFLMLTGSAVSIQMHKGLTNMVPDASKQIDNDQGLIQQLRKKAEQDEQLNAQHQIAMSKVNDLNAVAKAQSEYNEIQKIAHRQQANNFNNSLVLSETQSMGESIKKQAVASAVSNDNRKLLEMQKMIQNIRNEEAFMRQMNQKPKNVHLKGTRDSESESAASAISVRSSKSIRSNKSAKSNASNKSTKSTKSVMSINPNIKTILEENEKQRDSESLRSSGKSESGSDLSNSSNSSGSKSAESETESLQSTPSEKSVKSVRLTRDLNLEDKINKIRGGVDVQKRDIIITDDMISFGSEKKGKGRGTVKGRK